MGFARGTAITPVTNVVAGNTIATGAFNLAAHRTLIVPLKWEIDDAVPTSVVDTAGNTYIGLNTANDATNHLSVRLYYVLDTAANASNVITATWAGSTSDFKAIVPLQYTFAGVPTFNAQPAGAIGGSSTAMTTASFAASDMAVCLGMNFSGFNVTPGSGYIEQYDDSGTTGTAVEDRIDTPGGNIVGNMTISSAAFWAVVAASFSDTPAPTGGIPGPRIGEWGKREGYQRMMKGRM